LGRPTLGRSKYPRKGSDKGAIGKKVRKIMVFDIPGALKLLFTNRDLGGATSNVGRPKCLATTVWPWRPYVSSAPADEFSSFIICQLSLCMQ
jgi:hypothetical protein